MPDAEKPADTGIKLPAATPSKPPLDESLNLSDFLNPDGSIK